MTQKAPIFDLAGWIGAFLFCAAIRATAQVPFTLNQPDPGGHSKYWRKGESDQRPELAGFQRLEVVAHDGHAERDERNDGSNDYEVNDAARGLDASLTHDAD